MLRLLIVFPSLTHADDPKKIQTGNVVVVSKRFGENKGKDDAALEQLHV